MDWVNTPLGPTKKNLKSLGGIWAEQYSVEILVESTPPRQLSSILEPVRNRVKELRKLEKQRKFRSKSLVLFDIERLAINHSKECEAC